MSTVRRAVAINFLQNYGIIFLQFIGSLILARLLAPSEIGVYSVAASLVAIGQTVRDFGVGQYIVQERDLTADCIRSAFAVALLIASILALVTASLSGVAAQYFREPGLRNVLLLLSVSFLAIPFGQITLGLLQREMRFTAIAAVKVVSAIVHTTVAVLLAYLDFSYMSLAWASLAGIASSALHATYFRPAEMPWLPGLKEIRRVVKFGSYSVLGNVAIAVSKGAPDFVLGRLMNMTAVGLFSRAGSLVELFHRGVMNALWSVALPHFSKASREGGDLKGDFLNSAAMITGLAWPFFALASILSTPMIDVLYGANWLASAPLVKWICLGFAIIAPFYLVGSLLVSMGRVGANMWIEVTTIPILISLLVVAAFQRDLEMVAIAYAAYCMIKSIIAFALLRAMLNLVASELVRSLWRSGVLAAAAASGSYMALSLASEEVTSIGRFSLGSIGSLVGWLAAISFINHPLSREARGILRQLRRVK